MLISNFFYILAAVLPAIIILLYVFKQDAFPEPKEIVIKTFIFGAAITIALDLFIGDFDRFSEKNLTGETYFFFDSFIRAAFLEEIFKMMIIVFYCALVLVSMKYLVLKYCVLMHQSIDFLNTLINPLQNLNNFYF